ncbi:hypothetical protein CMK11_00960 [Candidatus Poribacteria bacterium]|nr:hypothetical protein [Candidatus Poribacteria bacterium]
MAWVKDAAEDSDRITSTVRAEACDLIVLTNSCDIAQHNVPLVLLCPAHDVTDYCAAWLAGRSDKSGHKGAWRTRCTEIQRGRTQNLTVLGVGNGSEADEGDGTDYRVVDFSEPYTLPLAVLKRHLHVTTHTRICLLPPYCEHLSQAFARYHMRVGLPTSVPDNFGEEALASALTDGSQ